MGKIFVVLMFYGLFVVAVHGMWRDIGVTWGMAAELSVWMSLVLWFATMPEGNPEDRSRLKQASALRRELPAPPVASQAKEKK